MATMDANYGQFLYEHRESCNQIAMIQLGLFIFSFIFTYTVWWAPIFGILVAAIGYYGSLAPVVQNKVSFIQCYYYGNCFILLLQIISSIVLIVVISSWDKATSWGYAVVVLGTICFLVEIYITYMAIQKSHSYRAELMRNPPPSDALSYPQQAAYTSMPNGAAPGTYKAPSKSPI